MCLSSLKLTAWGHDHSLGSLFQCSTNLCGKNLFLKSSINLPWHSSTQLPWILSLDTQNRDQHCPPEGRCHLQLKKPRDLSYFSYGFPSRNFVLLLQMLRALDPSDVVMAKGLKVRPDPKREQKGTIPSLAQLVNTAGPPICQSIRQFLSFN